MRPARWLAALLVLALAGSCTAAHERKLQAGARPSIVNGVDAPVGRYRYIASLRAPQNFEPGNYHICGGTLIAPTLVMTAAHCLKNPSTDNLCATRPPLLSVRVGMYTRTGVPADEGGEERGVVGAYAHPQWKCTFDGFNLTTNFMDNDVAILQLDAPIDTIAPVQLIGLKPKPNWNNPVRTRSPATVIGWGSTTDPFFGQTPADNLQQMRMQVLGLQETCQAYYGEADWGAGLNFRSYNSFRTNSMICGSRYWPESNGGFCVGDSGGPLIFTGPNAATDKQIGIVSFGPPACNDPVVPYVYTDIGNVFPWIEATRKQLQARPVTAGVSGPLPIPTGFDSIKRDSLQPVGVVYTILRSTELSWTLSGRIADGTGLNQVLWEWAGLGVSAIVDGSELTVVVNGRTVAPNTYTRGGDGAVRFSPIRAGVSKSVQITQAGAVVVNVVQPWVREGGAWGWAPRLDVSITLNSLPADLAAFEGQLAFSFPTQTGLVYSSATAARVARRARRSAVASKLPATVANRRRFAVAKAKTAAAAKRG